MGKTELSLQLAEKIKGEIVSADSRQVYRFMDIGTAKPSLEQRRRVPHHFIDIRNPDEYYSAGEYGREARTCIDHLLAAKRPPIVVGGSGFYIRALVDGLFAPSCSDPEVKAQLRARMAEEGLPALYQQLQTVDPIIAARLHANDAQRIIRALEVYQLTDKPISSFHQGDEQPAAFTPLFFGLIRPRQDLYQRIEQRVDAMLSEGLIDEVRELQKMGYSMELNALRTVGYQEVWQYLCGILKYEEMVDAIKLHSRQYAKRQLTWFRRDPRIHWFDLEQFSREEVIAKIGELL